MGGKSINTESNKRFIKNHQYIKTFNKQKYFKKVNHKFTNNVINGGDQKDTIRHFKENKIKIKSRHFGNHHKKPCSGITKY